MTDRIDCASFRHYGKDGCAALKDRTCRSGPCKFYKPYVDSATRIKRNHTVDVILTFLRSERQGRAARIIEEKLLEIDDGEEAEDGA